MTDLGSVPSVPEEDGNSGASSSSSTNALYKYDFVINNYTTTELCQLKQTLSKICKKALFGLEIGECGTPHIQGYMSLKRKTRFTGLHKLSGLERASFRPARNEKALIEYCQKDGCEFTLGFPKPLKLISTLYEWQQEVVAIIQTEPDDRKVYWYWSKEGNMGKSAIQKYLVAKHNCVPAVSGKYADIVNLVFNQDMDNCNTIVFDIPRNNGNSVSYSAIESIKNGMIVNTKYETGYKLFNPPHIFVFANEPPETEKLSMDRWVIKNID